MTMHKRLPTIPTEPVVHGSLVMERSRRKTFEGQRAMHDHYREVKVRLNSAPKRVCAETVQAAVHDVAPATVEADPIWWEEIIGTVCDHYGITVEAVIGPSRMEHLVRARHVVMYLTDILTENSHRAIGRALDKDPAAIRHGISRIEALIRVDRVLAAEVETLRLQLIGGAP